MGRRRAGRALGVLAGKHGLIAGDTCAGAGAVRPVAGGLCRDPGIVGRRCAGPGIGCMRPCGRCAVGCCRRAVLGLCASGPGRVGKARSIGARLRGKLLACLGRRARAFCVVAGHNRGISCETGALASGLGRQAAVFRRAGLLACLRGTGRRGAGAVRRGAGAAPRLIPCRGGMSCLRCCRAGRSLGVLSCCDRRIPRDLGIGSGRLRASLGGLCRKARLFRGQGARSGCAGLGRGEARAAGGRACAVRRVGGFGDVLDQPVGNQQIVRAAPGRTVETPAKRIVLGRDGARHIDQTPGCEADRRVQDHKLRLYHSAT